MSRKLGAVLLLLFGSQNAYGNDDGTVDDDNWFFDDDGSSVFYPSSKNSNQDDRMVLGAAGSACPSGYSSVPDYYSCRAAIDHFGFMGWDWKGEETDTSYPMGCYSCYGVSGCTKGVWWNNADTDSTVAGTRRLCSRNGHNWINLNNILFMGDSDPDYWGQTSTTYWKAFHNSSSVAVGGATCDDVLNSDDIDGILAAYVPKTVILVCGENDFSSGYSVADTFSKFKQIVAKILDAGASKVLYMGTKPEPGTTDLHTKYQEYDALIFDLAKGYDSGTLAPSAAPSSSSSVKGDAPLSVVDVYKGFQHLGNPASLYQSDDLHLTSEGYGHWETWAQSALATTSCVKWRNNKCVDGESSSSNNKLPTAAVVGISAAGAGVLLVGGYFASRQSGAGAFGRTKAASNAQKHRQDSEGSGAEHNTNPIQETAVGDLEVAQGDL